MIEALTEIKSSNLFFNELRTVALIFVRMMQTELQKYIFENILNTNFLAIEKLDSSGLENLLSAASTFSLEKFCLVL